MSKVLLLKKEHLAKLTNISFNVDIDKITPFIYLSQTTKLREMLGCGLYDEILEQFENDTLTPENTIIYEDYIIDYLVYYTAYYYWSFGVYQIDNAGAYKTTADNSEFVDEETIIRVSKMWAQQAENVRLNLERKLSVTSGKTSTTGLNWFLGRGSNCKNKCNS